MGYSRTFLLVAALAFHCTASAWAAGPNKPAGVYLHVDMENMLKLAKVEHADDNAKRAYIVIQLTLLLSNRALSGITAGVDWSTIEQKKPPGGQTTPQCPNCDWTVLDAVFEAANKVPGRTVQLIVTPGFNSPNWLKQELMPCDGIFVAPKIKPETSWDCGSAQFINFPEQQRSNKDPHSDTYTLPLPWSSTYQTAWGAFLAALNTHVQDQTKLVAIAIAGPVAGSDEMILPTTANDFKGVHSTTQVGGNPSDQGWQMLIKNYDRGGANYPPTLDQIFIDAWTVAIKKYETTFSGLTIFLGPDAGNDLPTLPTFKLPPKPTSGTAQLFYAAECSSVAEQFAVSCETKREVISNFLAATGPNLKKRGRRSVG